ncbi:MAG TPA: type II toxin-antitoxin system RelE/ParE family toxin [Humisphaera sp.]|jgi:mRNA-degrading endonuclease RelE of RelBE toxin-antitoxin system|nr:type II toxin-antitoxin system RelE/ParE family toxin [Humisphaera sp.]
MAFEIQYAQRAVEDLESFRAFDQRRILQAIEMHLQNEPKRTSRSRIKTMTQPFWSEYRLRVDEFRVYYDVDEPSRMVNVLRILKKTTGQTEQNP